MAVRHGARDGPEERGSGRRHMTWCELIAVVIVFGFTAWLVVHAVPLPVAIGSSLALLGGSVVVLRISKPVAALIQMLRTLPPLEPPGGTDRNTLR